MTWRCSPGRRCACPGSCGSSGSHVAKFPLDRRANRSTCGNQNTLLASYRGDIGGKIGWTSQARATYIGWARRGGHTLIVTLMHCTPLTEMVLAAKLLNWGFAMDGKVRPVGQLAAPLPARPACPPRAAGPATAPRVARQVRASGFPADPGRGGRGGAAGGGGAGGRDRHRGGPAPAARRKPTRSMTVAMVCCATGRARAAP